MSLQPGEKTVKRKPVLSFGISSILGDSADDYNQDANVNDLQKQEVRASILTFAAQGVGLNDANTELNAENEARSMDCFVSRVPGSLTGTLACSTTAAKCDAVQESESLPSSSEKSSGRSTLAAAAFPLVPCLTPHALMIKPLERYRPKGLVSEYRRVGHPYSNRTPAKRKKPRTTFSRDQIAELEARFMGQKYLASTERLRLAKHLQLTDAQVKTWFQNRRTKWRRQTAEEREAERNAATKYIMKMQESAAAAAAFWTPLLNLNCRGEAFGSNS